jgi:hypothetical protein
MSVEQVGSMMTSGSEDSCAIERGYCLADILLAHGRMFVSFLHVENGLYAPGQPYLRVKQLLAGIVEGVLPAVNATAIRHFDRGFAVSLCNI